MAGHLVILVAATFAGVQPLVWFNVGSCIAYAVACVAARREHLHLALAIGLVEVAAHSWFATSILGFASGFHIYALGLIPLAMTFEPWALRVRVGLAAVLVLNYLALAVVGHTVFEHGDGIIVDAFCYGNFTVGAIVLAALSYYYVIAVTHAEKALVRQNEDLNSLSRTDQLTQLPNRRHALEWLVHEHARAQRYGSVATICIGDLDDFKRINDRYGHDAGDGVLARVADVIRTTVRKQDVTARWGGEEFLILLPDTDREGGIVAMEKVRAAVSAERFVWDGTAVDVSITIGLSELCATCGLDEALRRADEALYRGKDEGRDTVVAGGHSPARDETPSS
ncbi:MAG: GGDEF domain-containing protein [Spirochaetota bacterium]